MMSKCHKIIWTLVILLASVVVYFPARHARYYEFIYIQSVSKEIVYSAQIYNSNYLKNCTYEDVILNNTEVPISDITKAKRFIKPLLGGEFKPKHCRPQIKTAIIVPYRDRSEQLQIFLNYMHPFLQNQNLEYRIFVVEQNNSLPFNRAEMLNYGAKFAINLNYPCLILHDVDLIPLCTGNIYGCSQRPRHMSSCLDTFRYNLPYLTLFGGAIAILSEQYKQVNGMSNLFFGWGGEDDDFYNRLENHKLIPYRFDPEISRYTMLTHKKQSKNEKRFDLLKKSIGQTYDGLYSSNKKYSIVKEDLMTRIVV